MAIKVEMLRCFAAVAESGNLADAADKLGRTPSAVSMMLKQFEDHLGAALFESERKSRLTPLGAFALREATRELDHFERTVASIDNFARSKAGYVRIAAVPSVAEKILPQVVRSFLAERPGVRIDIRDMDSAGVLRELGRERVDIGLATGVGAGAEIESDSLFSDAFGVVCRADHPLAASKAPLSWDALKSWPYISSGITALIDSKSFQQVSSSSLLVVRNTTSLLAMVRADVGVTVLPRLVVDAADADLVFLTVADQAARRSIDILKRAHTSLTPAAGIFEQTLRRITGKIVAEW